MSLYGVLRNSLPSRVRSQSAQLMPEARVALGCFGIVLSPGGVVVVVAVTQCGCIPGLDSAPPVRLLAPPPT